MARLHSPASHYEFSGTLTAVSMLKAIVLHCVIMFSCPYVLFLLVGNFIWIKSMQMKPFQLYIMVLSFSCFS